MQKIFNFLSILDSHESTFNLNSVLKGQITPKNEKKCVSEPK